jgi:hypothetical protein
MATRLADVIVPEVFNPYVVERTAELSRLRASGIIGAVPGLDVPDGGITVNMPFWGDLSGDDEVLSDTDPLSVNKIQAKQDMAVVLARGKAWGANDLASAFSGSDVMGAIGSMVAEYRARQEQRTLLAILTGVFGSKSMTCNLLDAPAEAISRDLLIDALSLLGDASGSLTGILCHSAVLADLAKKATLDARANVGDTNTAPEFQTFLGRQVIADDGCPVEVVEKTRVYTTYMFGPGALGIAEGSPPVPTETDRQSLAGNDILVNRRHFILHPRGVKWTNAAMAAGKPTPGNAELAAAANWERVWEPKNVRIVALRHRIG